MVHNRRRAECAVCRCALTEAPYPNFELDDAISRYAGQGHEERVKISRHLASQAEILVSEETLRLRGLLSLLMHLESVQVTHVPECVTRRIVECARAPASGQELSTTWRILAHLAEYVPQNGVLSAEIHLAAGESLVSPHATRFSNRAIGRTVTAISQTHACSFSHLIDDSSWVTRIARTAPAVLARLALANARGVDRLADFGVLSHTLVAAIDEEHLTARALLTSALSNDACMTEVRQAARSMIVKGALHAESVAAICWNDAPTAAMIADLHCNDVRRALEGARTAGFETQLAVIDLLLALHDNGGHCDADLVGSVVDWMSTLGENARDFAASYVSACSRDCVLCARAVLRHHKDVFSEPYVAGDVFVHDELVREHADDIRLRLAPMTFTAFSEVYFASSLVQSASGVGVVKEQAVEALRACAERAEDEVLSEIAHDCLRACCE